MDPRLENSPAGKAFSELLAKNMAAAAAETPEAFVARVEKKKPREVEDAPHLSQAVDFQEELDRREAARILAMHMSAPKPSAKHTIVWLDEWAAKFCEGNLPVHNETIQSSTGNIIWRFTGFCPVCRLVHQKDASMSGNCWTIAWDGRSTNCVVTCLKTRVRKFVQHPDY